MHLTTAADAQGYGLQLSRSTDGYVRTVQRRSLARAATALLAIVVRYAQHSTRNRLNGSGVTEYLVRPSEATMFGPRRFLVMLVIVVAPFCAYAQSKPDLVVSGSVTGS